MTLRERLLNRIRRDGPLSFAEFMEAALYDPEEGFYARAPVGEDGHFVTSPHVSPAFGALLGRQIGQVWDVLGRPPNLTVVEVGAGDGTLARQILQAVGSVPELGDALRYVAVERSAGARRLLTELPVEVRSSLEEVEPFTGCLLANELLDNVPFHRLRERDGRRVEVLVGADGDRLVEVEDEPSEEALRALREPLRPDEERPVAPAALDLIREVADRLRRGYAFLFDYGFRAEEPPGPVHAYRDHRVLAEVLEDPGSRDVTAAVDLGSVAAEASRGGLKVWGPIPQREALLGLGFRTWVAGLQSRQREAQVARRAREATRLYSERNRASILVDPDKLGGLHLLTLGTQGLPPPAAALGDRQTGS